MSTPTRELRKLQQLVRRLELLRRELADLRLEVELGYFTPRTAEDQARIHAAGVAAERLQRRYSPHSARPRRRRRRGARA